MESQNIEFKQDIPKGKGLKAEISSFLNTTGGKIYLGVDDNGVPIHFTSDDERIKNSKNGKNCWQTGFPMVFAPTLRVWSL